MIATHQIVQHLLEDEDTDFDFKEMLTPVPAAAIERWAFTDYELHHPYSCRARDEFYTTVEGCEFGVSADNDGGGHPTFLSSGVPFVADDVMLEFDGTVEFFPVTALVYLVA
jgi:hypothetical protein